MIRDLTLTAGYANPMDWQISIGPICVPKCPFLTQRAAARKNETTVGVWKCCIIILKIYTMSYMDWFSPLKNEQLFAILPYSEMKEK